MSNFVIFLLFFHFLRQRNQKLSKINIKYKNI
nr:MAG TPA: hypothetical protein [Caudoviricetes sp.]